MKRTLLIALACAVSALAAGSASAQVVVNPDPVVVAPAATTVAYRPYRYYAYRPYYRPYAYPYRAYYRPYYRPYRAYYAPYWGYGYYAPGYGPYYW